MHVREKGRTTKMDKERKINCHSVNEKERMKVGICEADRGRAGR